jgi:hypothetical protein
LRRIFNKGGGGVKGKASGFAAERKRKESEKGKGKREKHNEHKGVCMY